MDDQQQHDSTRLGRSMVYIGWIAGLVLLAWMFNAQLTRQHNPNQSVATLRNAEGMREVQLTRNRQGHYVASGLINGVPVTFLLDTGATDVAVSQRVAKQAGLEQGRAVPVQTANGIVTAYLTRIDRISIGDIELADVRASINPSLGIDEVLLGMAFLKRLELTQKGDTLTLRQGP